MAAAAFPTTEKFRLLDLASFEVLDTETEDPFDELVELAGQICNCPISLISLVDKERQWFKATKGTELRQTPRDLAFCAHAILQEEVFVVEDTLADARFYDNPFVTGNHQVRFYAGAPIVSPDGNNLGTICILDNRPRSLSASQERALVILSNQVTQLLELRKKNMLIRERAEEIIKLKTKTIESVLAAQEEEKKMIASNLHEDLAQGVASSIFYLQTAESDQNQAAGLIKFAKKQLQEILRNMQSLSYSITPHVIDLLPPKDLVAEYTEKIAGTYHFDLSISTSGTNQGTAANAISAIRVIEEWCKVLSSKKDVRRVAISVNTEEEFEVLINDDGQLLQFALFEQKIYDSLIYERVQASGGSITYAHRPAGGNTLSVTLPFTLQAV